MKLLKLELCNFRGVSQDVYIEPNGENMVVLGANGTGKSTLVDAIDFLLSGTIDRLLGEGTGGVTLQQHGHHVDANPENAWVRADVVLPGGSEPVSIERHLNTPKTPNVTEQAAGQLQQIFTLASNRQHILTRRQVLHFIHAPPSKRAERMQALLGISKIKLVRDSLVRARGIADKEANATRRAVLNAKSALAASMNVDSFRRADLLAFVNENRAFLNVAPIDKLQAFAVAKDINLSFVEPNEPSLNPELLARDIKNLNNQFSPTSLQNLIDKDTQLRRAIRLVLEQPVLQKALKAHQLTLMGVDLLDDHGDCPLCDTPWPPGDLRTHLEQKLERADRAQRIHNQISSLAAEIANKVRIAIATIENIIQPAEKIGEIEVENGLKIWRKKLTTLEDTLQDPMVNYLNLPYEEDQIASLFTNQQLMVNLSRFLERAKKIVVPVRPEQTVYELLIRISTELESLEKAIVQDHAVQKTYKRAQKLLESFERSRDDILSALYDDVRERFESLYRQLHAEDESAFTAIIEPEGAGVIFEVDYFGRGKYPPNAIHSEGHQDSMGVCLFLALSEHINQGKLELVVLDDVLMAIDIDHRRAFSQLLKDAFPERQFLITTHDRTWANQLKYQGVVRSRGFIEISHWDLDSGPRINSETDVWEKIEIDLLKHDIGAAAARLRRSSEEFYGQVCHHLKAKVHFNMTGRYELGDFLPAAQSQYKELLKKAKASANSWGNDELLTMFNEIDEGRKEIYSQLNAEQWAVNPAVHYNNWENFSPADFLPVIETFQKLQKLFLCHICGSLTQLVEPSPSSVRCRCGQINWNLEKR